MKKRPCNLASGLSTSRKRLTAARDLPAKTLLLGDREVYPGAYQGGPYEGSVFELDMMLDDYYQARGWD